MPAIGCLYVVSFFRDCDIVRSGAFGQSAVAPYGQVVDARLVVVVLVATNDGKSTKLDGKVAGGSQKARRVIDNLGLIV